MLSFLPNQNILNIPPQIKNFECISLSLSFFFSSFFHIHTYTHTHKRHTKKGMLTEKQQDLTKYGFKIKQHTLSPLKDSATDSTGFYSYPIPINNKPISKNWMANKSATEIRKQIRLIREVGWKVRADHIITNGITAGEIATDVVLSRYLKRTTMTKLNK